MKSRLLQNNYWWLLPLFIRNMIKFSKIIKGVVLLKDINFDEMPQNLGKVHYLSHRPVLREDKEATKLMAVLNASCASNSPSLNDCLYAAPNLLAKIFGILLRFILNYIGILADIKQVFLNVENFAKHQKFLRFL